MPGRPVLHAPIADISRSGLSVRCDWQPDAGTEARIELPGADRPIAARSVHSDGRVLGLGFQQDAATLRLVDQALAAIGTRRNAAAA